MLLKLNIVEKSTSLIAFQSLIIDGIKVNAFVTPRKIYPGT